MRTPRFALDALLSAGTIDNRQHAAGLAYAAARRSHDRPQRHDGLSPERWAAMKHVRAALLDTAGFDGLLLDRLCLNDDAPLRCEVERVREALERVGEHSVVGITCAHCST